MPIIPRLTDEELALIEIIRHPVWCGEFIRGFDDNNWEYSDYQKEFLCDFNSYVSICCARAVGKTVALIDKLVWLVVNLFWDESIVYTVPSKVHLEPVFLRLTRWFRNHPLLRYYVGKTGINSQVFTIKTLNGAIIDCRIAGQTGTGVNIVGLHVPVVIGDEMALYPWGTYIELLPTLNTFEDGFQLIVSGVPTGMREKNVLYHTDQKDTQFTKHRVSAHQNPRYTEVDEERNIKQLGGKESEDYIHLILGEHGAPVYILFDRARMLIEQYEIFHGTIYGAKLKEDKTLLNRFYSSLPSLPTNIDETMFGVDLGYSEPTVIHILYRPKAKEYWKYLCRITLNQVPYPTQEVILDTLDTLYKPNILGIDEGNIGVSVIQHLISDKEYRTKDFKARIVPIQFRSLVPIGFSEDGEEISVRAKEFSMQLLQTWVNEHKICFSAADETVISELERTTYLKTASGELVFRTVTPRGGLRHGGDHNVSALLCATLAHYLVTEVGVPTTKKVKLYKPTWGLF